MRKSIIITIAFTVSCLACCGELSERASAAEKRDVADLHSAIEEINAQQLSFQGQNFEGLATAVSNALHLEANSKLQLEKQNRLPNGNEILRYEQTFRGIPIWGERVIVTRQQDGSVQNLSGKATFELASSLLPDSPKLAKDAAIKKAAEAALTLPGNKKLIDIRNVKIREIYFVGDDGMATSAFEISFAANAPDKPEKLSEPHVILAASSGLPLKIWDGVANDGLGVGPGGNKKTGLHIFGKQHFPKLNLTRIGDRCLLKSEDVWTEDMQNTVDGTGKPFEFKCFENRSRSVNGAYSPMNDAQFYGQIVVDMYKSWFGKAPINFPLHLRVHFSKDFENAYWGNDQMTFGDGGQHLYPLVSLDVMGHEVSHGFTQYNSGLIYKDQSGAINESFSDMAGQATEYFAKEKYGEISDPDFTIGSSVVKRPASALRYMCDPQKDGASIGDAREFKSGMDPHFGSGVFNRAFCLLSKSDGWDIKKSFQVFVVANQNYWTPAATFQSAAEGTRLAAAALGYDVSSVNQAFAAVGISDQPPGGDAVPQASNADASSAFICSFLGEGIAGMSKPLRPDPEAEKIIEQIVSVSGLSKNFEVVAASVPNAAAKTANGLRYVLYNPDFMTQLSTAVKNRWAPVSVLAHEVGHHLNGHTLSSIGSQPKLELEADYFSGFVLEKMGASLADARVVLEKYGSAATTTHPAKEDRLAAIADGWSTACRKDPDCLPQYAKDQIGGSHIAPLREDSEDGSSKMPGFGNAQLPQSDSGIKKPSRALLHQN